MLVHCKPEQIVRLMIELFPAHSPQHVQLSGMRNGNYSLTLFDPTPQARWYTITNIRKIFDVWMSVRNKRSGDRYILRVLGKSERMHYEVTTLMYVARRLQYAVPNLVAYSKTTDNALGGAYMLQERLPGQPLHELWSELNTKQRQSAIRCLARVFKDIHEVTNTCAGVISILNTAHDIKVDLIRVEPFPISPHPTATLATPQTPRDLLLSLCEQQRGYAIARGGPTFPHIWHGFTIMINKMHALGLLPDDQPFHLHNPSLSPHTLLLTIVDDSTVSVSGILSWSDAVFAPKFVSTLAPWDAAVRFWDVIAADAEERELLRYMLNFYDIVGGDYGRGEERREYVLARRMWRVLVEGVRSGGDVGVAEGVLREFEGLLPMRD
ncbi:hypothetical protein P153DRAFT_333867 [Dothidotthia symphoricarpi CBS 119687]|uniref:Uncharacterized protein n=1 Tax=Dothidotthia symphoricarpi CBS 119687 TaxID=1392245 RepID=A0A6A6APY7_9PLEO|nr:uncharacterized protein P153DRAFT_333867 [Dothidotthia symphoricarpi CBS 119687]KAF2133014.1 hypothetical protein P153DRAFT_333867 [Dothidotthia symphoricarpi CBS 119687]